MKDLFKFLVMLFVTAVLGYLGLMLTRVALEVMNEHSHTANVIGFIMLLVCTMGTFYTIIWAWIKAYETETTN